MNCVSGSSCTVCPVHLVLCVWLLIALDDLVDLIPSLTSCDVQNNVCSVHTSSKIRFENLQLLTYGDLGLILTSHDAKNVFSMHRSSKRYFLKNLHLITFGQPPHPL